MTLTDKLTAIDNVTTLWLCGELSAHEALEFIEAIVEGEVFVL